MTDEGLPMSRQRFEELTEGMGEEARVILDRIMANQELSTELRQQPEEILAGIEDLPQGQRERLIFAIEEFYKAYGRSMREAEAVVSLAERGQEVFERATELDDSLGERPKLEDAIAVLKAHGEEVPISNHELSTVIKVPLSREHTEWVAVPESEIPTDENGIPTKRAARDGYGIKTPEGAIIKLYPRQVEAMRALASAIPYRDFVEERLEEAAKMKREFLGDLGDLADNMRLLGQPPERFAEMTVAKVFTDSYQQVLAMMVKEYPHDPQGIIDACHRKDTKAARRYKEWTARQFVKAGIEKIEAEAMEAGALELIVGKDGKEYLRKGPNFKEYFGKDSIGDLGE